MEDIRQSCGEQGVECETWPDLNEAEVEDNQSNRSEESQGGTKEPRWSSDLAKQHSPTMLSVTGHTVTLNRPQPNR